MKQPSEAKVMKEMDKGVCKELEDALEDITKLIHSAQEYVFELEQRLLWAGGKFLGELNGLEEPKAPLKSPEPKK